MTPLLTPAISNYLRHVPACRDCVDGHCDVARSLIARADADWDARGVGR